MHFSHPTHRFLVQPLVLVLLVALGFVALLAANSGVDAQAGPHFALNASGAGVTCDDPGEPTQCTVPEGGSFMLAVDFISPPAAGYIALQTQLYVGSFIWAPASSDAENVWPDNELPVRFPAEPDIVTVIGHGGLTSIQQPFPPSNYEGTVAQIQLSCPAGITSGEIALVAYSPDTSPLPSLLGTAWTNPDFTTNATAATGSAEIDTDQDGQAQRVPLADTLAVRCGATAPPITPGEALPGYTPGPPPGQPGPGETPGEDGTAAPGETGTIEPGETDDGTSTLVTPVASPTDGPTDDDDDGSSTWLIVGIIVAVVVIAGGGGAAYIWYRRRQTA